MDKKSSVSNRAGRRFISVAGVAVGALLPILIPGQAEADRSPNVYVIAQDNGHELRYIARDTFGDANQVIIKDDYEAASTYTITDVHPLRPGTGCTSITQKKVVCNGSATPITSVKVFLNDGDDQAEVRATPGGLSSRNPLAIYGGKGQDTLVGGSEKSSLFGDEGNDNLFGFGGDDDLHGGMGMDILYGLDDNDTIIGDDGSDRLWGGPGADELHGAGIAASSTPDVQNALDGGDGGALGDDGSPMSTDRCLSQGAFGTVVRCEISFGS